MSKQYRFNLNKQAIYLCLKNALFKGRCEIHHTQYRDIIIDGAHNPQKMKAFLSTLVILYPRKKYDFLISFSEGKNQISTMRRMLQQIIPMAHSITVTDFILEGDDILHHSVEKERIIPILKQLKFDRYDFKQCNEKTIMKIIKNNKQPFVITGSLYLIGSIYDRLKKFLSS